MGFNRKLLPQEILPEQLNPSLVSIGINLASGPAQIDVNIENVLYFSSVEAIANDDYRLLSLITTWLGVHHRAVNLDRLVKLVGNCENQKFRAYWGSIGVWLGSDRRLLKLASQYHGPIIDLQSVGGDFQISRFGEDPRFKNGFLRVPANLLRDRVEDVLSPVELARKLPAYRNRIIIGPSYRADMWASLEENPNLSAAQIARKAYGSFATAWHVKQDWQMIHQTSV